MQSVDRQSGRAPAPWHLWAVGVASLLWNAFGCYLYTVANLEPETMLAQMPSEMADYARNMPIWAHIGWAFGIWSSLLGSILLLIRSRHAVNAFAVSALGAVVSYASQMAAGVLTPVEPLMILGAIALQWFYSQRMKAAGVLR